MRHLLCLAFILLTAGLSSLGAQPRIYSSANVHSHNDYEQDLPFYNAYARHFGSIEADLWAVDGQLYVAHNREEVSPSRTFEKLYLQPLLSRLDAHGGHPYKNGAPLQLLIDLKSPWQEVMPLLSRLLQPYRRYFDMQANPHAVRLVISGSMPPPDSLHRFDPIFTFDGRLGQHYPAADLSHVTLVSADVQQIVRWHAMEALDAPRLQRLQQVVDSVHAQHKLIRFWATPNTDEAYHTLMKLGVDYIGTDNLPLLECLLRAPARP